MDRQNSPFSSRLLRIVILLSLSIACVGPCSISVLLGKPQKPFRFIPINPKSDITLAGGSYTVTSLAIPENVRVSVTGDLELKVKKDIHIVGELVGYCSHISLIADGDILITGMVDNSCDIPGEDLEKDESELYKDLIIHTNQGNFQIGTEEKPAEIYTSGTLDLSDDPSFEEWQVYLSEEEMTAVPMAPVCYAESDVVFATISEEYPAEIGFYGYGIDPNRGPVTYKWDFGDGNTSTLQEPINVYTDPGSYDVKLIITDQDNESCTATINIAVDDLEQPRQRRKRRQRRAW